MLLGAVELVACDALVAKGCQFAADDLARLGDVVLARPDVGGYRAPVKVLLGIGADGVGEPRFSRTSRKSLEETEPPKAESTTARA